MEIFTLTLSLTKLSSDDFPTPVVPTTVYKASRVFIGDEEKESAKTITQFLAQRAGLATVALQEGQVEK